MDGGVDFVEVFLVDKSVFDVSFFDERQAACLYPQNFCFGVVMRRVYTYATVVYFLVLALVTHLIHLPRRPTWRALLRLAVARVQQSGR